MSSSNRFANHRALKRVNSQSGTNDPKKNIASERQQLLAALPADSPSLHGSLDTTSHDDDIPSFTSSLNKRRVLVLGSLALTELGSFMCLSILAPFFPKEVLM